MGCVNAATVFVSRDGYDEDEQIKALFSEPIEWSEEAAHLRCVVLAPVHPKYM